MYCSEVQPLSRLLTLLSDLSAGLVLADSAKVISFQERATLAPITWDWERVASILSFCIVALNLLTKYKNYKELNRYLLQEAKIWSSDCNYRKIAFFKIYRLKAYLVWQPQKDFFFLELKHKYSNNYFKIFRFSKDFKT